MVQYNFYSHIHRFMRQYLYDFGADVAKTDFSNSEQRAQVKVKLNEFIALLKQHAEHEDNVYHPLLVEKEPELVKQMETEHKLLDEQLHELMDLLDAALHSNLTEEEQHVRGEDFYLNYTLYISDYFKHLAQEEKVFMPALRKNYTNQRLKEITFKTYRKDEMTNESMLGMLSHLFPYLNRYQRQVFLDDIYEACPDKFAIVFPKILSEIVDEQEKILLRKRYGKNEENRIYSSL